MCSAAYPSFFFNHVFLGLDMTKVVWIPGQPDGDQNNRKRRGDIATQESQKVMMRHIIRGEDRTELCSWFHVCVHKFIYMHVVDVGRYMVFNLRFGLVAFRPLQNVLALGVHLPCPSGQNEWNSNTRKTSGKLFSTWLRQDLCSGSSHHIVWFVGLLVFMSWCGHVQDTVKSWRVSQVIVIMRDCGVNVPAFFFNWPMRLRLHAS